MDSIRGDNPEGRLRDALAQDARNQISDLNALVDPRLTEDDITILLVKRVATHAASTV